MSLPTLLRIEQARNPTVEGGVLLLHDDGAAGPAEPAGPAPQRAALVQPRDHAAGDIAVAQGGAAALALVPVLRLAHGFEQLQLGARVEGDADKRPVDVIGVANEYDGSRQPLLFLQLVS